MSVPQSRSGRIGFEILSAIG